MMFFFYYTFMKSWKGYIFTPVCLCVCLSVCQWKNSSQKDALILTWLSLNDCLQHALAWTLLKFGDLWSKVKVKVTQYPFSLHNSLITSLQQICAILSPWSNHNEIWYIRCLDMPFVDSHLNFIKTERIMTSLWRKLSFL